MAFVTLHVDVIPSRQESHPLPWIDREFISYPPADPEVMASFGFYGQFTGSVFVPLLLGTVGFISVGHP